MDFLSECKACFNIIPMRSVNCRFCGSFQMHVDTAYFNKKIMSFELLASHRIASEERIEAMYHDGYDHKMIKDQRKALDKRRKILAQSIMEKIEEKEYFLLN